MKILEIIIGAIILSVFVYKSGKLLFQDEKTTLNFKNVVLILLLTLFTTVINLYNFEIFRGIFKVLFVYASCCIFYRMTFKNTFAKNLTASLIVYLCMFVAEVSTALVASIVLSIMDETLEFLKHTLLINIIILSLAYIIIFANKKRLSQFVKNNDYNKRINIFIIIVMLITISLLVFRLPINQWKFDVEFIITMIILLCFCITGIYLLKQRSDIQKTASMYQQVVKYSNTTNKVLEDYRMINHEHKNQLSIIRQMIPKKNTEVIEYIDNLIAKRNIQKYKWVAELNKLPSEGLKGLINYKLIEMDDSGISSMVTISKKVSCVKLDKKLTTTQKDHLYSICGVYLDNAIQAAIKSKGKEITVDMYREKQDLVLIIANTYKGKIDLEKIDDYGYTTKGKNHGIGLHIVRTILDEDQLFSQNRKIIDKYFIQELRIHTDKFQDKKSKK